MPQIGMSVPGASGNWSAAGQALGFGGRSVADQIKDETEEERRKRLAAMQASRPGSVGAGYGDALSPVGQALGLGR